MDFIFSIFQNVFLTALRHHQQSFRKLSEKFILGEFSTPKAETLGFERKIFFIIVCIIKMNG